MAKLWLEDWSQAVRAGDAETGEGIPNRSNADSRETTGGFIEGGPIESTFTFWEPRKSKLGCACLTCEGSKGGSGVFQVAFSWRCTRAQAACYHDLRAIAKTQSNAQRLTSTAQTWRPAASTF